MGSQDHHPLIDDGMKMKPSAEAEAMQDEADFSDLGSQQSKMRKAENEAGHSICQRACIRTHMYT